MEANNVEKRFNDWFTVSYDRLRNFVGRYGTLDEDNFHDTYLFVRKQVVYQGKRTINMDSKGTVYLSKTMSIELGILGGGRVNFAHDEDSGEWYICHTTDKDGKIEGVPDSLPDSSSEESCFRQKWKGRPYSL